MHIDNQISEQIPILRGVRQGDPISPKLFTATIQEVFKEANLETKGIRIDGETLSDLRFADDVALLTKSTQDMEHQLNSVNKESLKVGLKIHRGKTKFMTNMKTTNTIQIEGTEIEKVDDYKYLGQTIAMENKTNHEVLIRIKAGWGVFSMYKEIFLDKQLPISLKRKVYDQCILPTVTYGCQTWSLTREILNKLEVSQRAMERKMLNIKLKDKIRNTVIRQRTQIKDVTEKITKTKWSWAGHIARMTDNRWTIRSTEWRVREGQRRQGRPKRRWRDDLVWQQGVIWSRKAKDRERWKTLAEGYLLQWKDTA